MSDEVNQGIVKDLKAGRFVVIDGEPCRVVGIDISKTGKHGSHKARVEALSLFTGVKKTLMKPADATIEIPILTKKAAQVVATLGGNRLQLMDLSSFEVFEMECPEEFKGKIVQGSEIEIQDVMGKKMIMRVKGE
jgi:translation initiation factor 5A